MSLKILILHADVGNNASTITKHIKSFSKYGTAKYSDLHISLLKFFPNLILKRYDIIILHYSVYFKGMPTSIRKVLKGFSKKKIAFVQDEYRHINDTIECILDIGVNRLYSVLDDQVSCIIYKRLIDSGVSIKHTLTGYADVPKLKDSQIEAEIEKWERRPIDIGYRARDLTGHLGWLGKKAYEKFNITKVIPFFIEKGFIVDVATNESARIYGEDWNEFLISTKITLLAESGASVADFTGDIQKNYLAAFEKNLNQNYLDEIIKKHDGKYSLSAISPRAFEAAQNFNLMIAYEDNYSGILEKNRHYIELKKDHSNLQEVLRKCRSRSLIKKILSDTYFDLIATGRYSYREFVKNFEEENKLNLPHLISNTTLPLLQLTKIFMLSAYVYIFFNKYKFKALTVLHNIYSFSLSAKNKIKKLLIYLSNTFRSFIYLLFSNIRDVVNLVFSKIRNLLVRILKLRRSHK